MSNAAPLLAKFEIAGRRSAVAGSRAYDVRIVRDAASADLWAIWAELERQGDCTVFQSRQFLRPLLQIVGSKRNAELHLCVVFDAIGPLLGLPFVVRRSRTASLIEIADFGLSDYCAPVMARRFDPCDAAAWAAIWATLAGQLPKADGISLEKMPALVAGRMNPFLHLTGVRPMLRETRQVAVDPVWLSTSVAKEAFAKRRKLERAGGSRFVIVDDPALIDHHLDLMRALRRRRFEAQGIQDSLDETGAFEFYRTLLHEGCADGGAVLGVVTFDGQPIAMSAALVHRGRFNGVLTAMDEKRASFSPGLVSMVGLFEWCLKQGVSVFDMGFGDQHYKSRFGGERSMLHEWSQARSLRGAVWKLERDARSAARRALRRYPALERLRGRGGKSG